jgi:hypothetical protein
MAVTSRSTRTRAPSSSLLLASLLLATVACSARAASLPHRQLLVACSARAAPLPHRQPPVTHAPVRMTGAAGDLASVERAARAKADQSAQVLFSEEELTRAVLSLRQLCPADADAGQSPVDWIAYRALVAQAAHRPHKQWADTRAAAAQLATIVGTPDDARFKAIFERVLVDGGWGAAERAAAGRADRPWAVLVTGVNGIRKTSSIYQPWFEQVLRAALGAEPSEPLPTGANCFFRQLDFIASTVACEELKTLYTVGDVGAYATFKDGVYSRYRTLAEMVGCVLVENAGQKQMNVMVETSGRDVAMFKYVDELFDDARYRKLVVHFEIDDLSLAEASVDRRMLGEQAAGRAALLAPPEEVAKALVDANAGGPYGSAVLAGVQAESNAVWARVADDPAFAHWQKARVLVRAREGADWTAAAHADGAAEFAFGPPPK